MVCHKHYQCLDIGIYMHTRIKRRTNVTFEDNEILYTYMKIILRGSYK